MTKTACCTGVVIRIQGWDVPHRQGEPHRHLAQGLYPFVESLMMPRARAVVVITAVPGEHKFFIFFYIRNMKDTGRYNNSCLNLV